MTSLGQMLGPGTGGKIKVNKQLRQPCSQDLSFSTTQVGFDDQLQDSGSVHSQVPSAQSS